MWPRVNGMRSMELGTPDGIRAELNSLVLAGRKTATTGLLAEYAEESEELELPGERLALVDDDGGFVAAIEITGVEVTTFGAVTWEHARAEGRARPRSPSGAKATAATGVVWAPRSRTGPPWSAWPSASSPPPDPGSAE